MKKNEDNNNNELYFISEPNATIIDSNNKKYINLSTNNYLCMSINESVKINAIETIKKICSWFMWSTWFLWYNGYSFKIRIFIIKIFW